MASRSEGTRVYIGDLGSGGSKPEIEKEFEQYGPLKSVWVARNPPGKGDELVDLVCVCVKMKFFRLH